jgi:mannose-6-phosphate isomerase-like protein (cupin superfamily)
MIVIPPGGGEVVGDAPDRRVEILSDVDPLHATWSRFGPRRAGADLHVHREHADHFYVLEGELTVMLGDDDVVVRAGELARVPPLVVHGFRNGTGAEVRYLNFHVPGVGFAGFMRDLRDGRPAAYDQFPPPDDGSTRPPSEASIGGGIEVERGRLLTDADDLAIAETVLEAEPAHTHAGHVESFYVLEGTATVSAGGRELAAGAGSWVQIPAAVAHAVTSAGRTRLLVLHTPNGGFGAFMRGDDAAFDRRPASPW